MSVSFFDDKIEKEFIGELIEADDKTVEIQSAKRSIRLTYEQITNAKVLVSFK